MENNFTIDYAKTLYMPTRPEHVNEIISQYIKAKVPHFFIYAKDKEEKNVEMLNDSVVNKFETIIPNKRITFYKIAGKLDCMMLMKNKQVELDQQIIDEYIKLNQSKKWMMKKQDNMKTDHKLYIYNQIKDSLLKINNDLDYVVDVLVKYLYQYKNSSYKETLWWSFGDVLLNNLTTNISGTIRCEHCGKRVEQIKQRQNLCMNCFDADKKKKAKIRKLKFKSKINRY
jgi:hypothetical protein